MRILSFSILILLAASGCAARRSCCCQCPCGPARATRAVEPAHQRITDMNQLPQIPQIVEAPVVQEQPRVRTVSQTPPAPTPAPVPVAQPAPAAPKMKEKGPQYDHADDYSWLVGKLQRVHMPGGEWKIRYAPLSVEDEWGGSVVLAPDVRLDGYKDGDIVRVEGEILRDRPTLYLSGPLYRIHNIRPADVEAKAASDALNR